MARRNGWSAGMIATTLGLLAGACGGSTPATPPTDASAPADAAATSTAEERSFDDFLAEVEQAAAQADPSEGEAVTEEVSASQGGADQAAAEPAGQPPPPALPAFSGWHKGATGYREALNEFAEGDRALAVYFYTDWCGYCRKFNGELLAVNMVERHLDGLVRVMINPDDGGEAESLAATWGVTGYPTFLIVAPGQERGSRISPFVQSGSRARTLTASEFVRECERAAQP